MYLLPALAHTVHIFGTILPLVFAIFLSGSISWVTDFGLELLINLTVPMTHFFYCLWTFVDYPDDNNASEGDDSKPPPAFGSIRKDYRIKNIPKYLVIGFFVGLVPLAW